ncbi:MAG TPA: hypothetical protein DC049_09275 [Spirochaetia bacterium]|nr:hypothetical protein [Spirochaetia bacterium]
MKMYCSFMGAGFLAAAAVFTIFSCGVSNPAETDVSLHPPVVFSSIPGDRSIQLVIEGQNRHSEFSGYNVYFDYTDNQQTIDEKLIVIDSSRVSAKPTVKMQPSENMQKTTLFLSEQFEYCLKNQNYNTGKKNKIIIENCVKYYFTVRAYSFINDRESERSEIIFETPRYEYINQTVKSGTVYTNHDFVFSYSADNFFYGFGGVLLQDTGWKENWSDIINARPDGYVSGPLPAQTGHLYMFCTTGSNYGKLFIDSMSGNTVFFKLTYQTNGMRI